MSPGVLRAHLVMSRPKDSISRNSRPEAVTHISTSLKHANNGAPNKSTETTSAWANCSLILQFDSPNNLELLRILLKAIFANYNRLLLTWRGHLAEFTSSSPRYLKVSQMVSFYLAMNIFPEQLTSITSVFLVLITRSFCLQNSANTETRRYNSSTDGANSTISSANANMHSCRPATT